MKRTNRLTALPIAAAFIGTVVGAGFATGQEVLQFFTFFGWKGFLGILLVTVLFCYFGLAIMKISRDLKAESHLDLVNYTLGFRLGTLMDWFITFSFLGVLIVMAAGAGAVAEEQLNLTPFQGSLAVIVLTFLTVIMGVKTVIRAIALVVPFLLLSLLGITFFSLFTDPPSLQKIAFLESLESPVTANWSLAGLLYVSYNIILAVAILASLGVEAMDKKSLQLGGILGGLGLGGGILAINLAVISGIPEILPFQVPMVFLAKKLNPLCAYIFGFILLLEIYTTAVSVLYGFTARVALNNIQRFCWAGVASVGALIAAQLGFSKVIAAVYPLMGVVGLFFLLSIIVAQLRERFRKPLFKNFNSVK
ncbi:MAG TPA: hypothetical protein GXX46_06195 [Peptococcaceae bacterium]|nr:hypothetical protein [Peptococcaceae bacterium]